MWQTLLAVLTGCMCAAAADRSDTMVHRESIAPPDTNSNPVVLGAGQGLFEIGPLLYSPRSSDPSNWQLQIQHSEAPTREKVTFNDNLLDLYMPDRGCTAWYRRRLDGTITIVYRVRCPLGTLKDPGIQARDINNFWHAFDPDKEEGIFDTIPYNGVFTTYNKMLGYYASPGGGGKMGNRTTRFRRYPRTMGAEDVPHIALTYRDGQQDFLITPGKWHTVQLIAWQGLAQYIVDGILVYEIDPGENFTV